MNTSASRKPIKDQASASTLVVGHPLTAGQMEGVDDSTWLDVIHKMDEVYARLINDEVELEQKNTELEQSQQFIFSVLGAMSDVLVVCDERGLIEQVNAALCELVGRSQSQLLGTPLVDLLADDASRARARDAMQCPDAAGTGVTLELYFSNHQAQSVSVDTNATPRFSARGLCMGTVWVGRPTAEIKRAYQELRTAHEALKRTQQQLLHSEKMASLGQLVAGVAHELNNPISFVLGNVHALRKYCNRLQTYMDALHAQRPDAELQALRHKLRIEHLLADLPELIEGTLEGAQRTADIVHGLKRFSAMDSGEFAPVHLVEVVERAIHWVQKGRAAPVEVRWEAASALDCRVLGSAGQLQQVLMNLLQNAFDAVSADAVLQPCVWVNLSADGEYARLSVRDNGTGIAPEHLLRLFDPFFTTKPVGKGTGLGLSISYGIAEQHGGQLTAHNATQGGGGVCVDAAAAVGLSTIPRDGGPGECALQAATARPTLQIHPRRAVPARRP